MVEGAGEEQQHGHYDNDDEGNLDPELNQSPKRFKCPRKWQGNCEHRIPVFMAHERATKTETCESRRHNSRRVVTTFPGYGAAPKNTPWVRQHSEQGEGAQQSAAEASGPRAARPAGAHRRAVMRGGYYPTGRV